MESSKNGGKTMAFRGRVLLRPGFAVLVVASGFLLAIAAMSFPVRAQNPQIAEQMRRIKENGVRITKQYLDLTRNHRGTQHPDYLDALIKYAQALAELDRDQEAQPALTEAIALGEKLYGRSDARLLPVLNPLIGGLVRQGKSTEAAPLAERAVAIARASYPPKHPELAVWLNNLGMIHKDTGRFASAEAMMREAIGIIEAQPGKPDPSSAINLDNLALMYQLTGRYKEALETRKRALALLEGTVLPVHRLIAVTVISNMGSLHADMGDFDAAEAAQRLALETSEKFLGADSAKTAELQVALATLYWSVGRHGEAETFLRRALETQKRLLGPEHPRVGVTINNLAQVYFSQGRMADAEPLMRQVAAIAEKNLGADHYELALYLSNLGLLLDELRQTGEAEKHLRRAVAIDEKAFGRDHPGLLTPLINLADLLHRRGGGSEAELLYRRALSIAETRLGADHHLTARAASRLARLAFSRQDWAAGYAHAARAGAITAARLSRTGNSLRGRPDELERTGVTDARRIFREQVQAAHRYAEAAPQQQAALRDAAFAAAQWASRTAAAQALANMAARVGAGGGDLAGRVRERQDLLPRWQAMDRALVTATSQVDTLRDRQAEAEMRAELARLAQRIEAIDQELARQYPAYSELAGAAPAGIAQTQAFLKPDEALIIFFDAPQTAELPEETFVWVMTRDTVRWRRIALGTAALARKVKALRCRMDSAAWAVKGPEGCAAFLGVADSMIPEAAHLFPFDAAGAHELYASLLKPDEDIIAGRHLLIVPSGALTQLPFQALLTGRPDSLDLRSFPWLARAHPVSILPAVSSLKALRGVARPSAATRPFIGFGNPLLDGPAGAEEDARLAREKQSCQPAPPTQMAALAGSRGGVRAMELRQGLANLALIRQQIPLPETADELCAVARDINADAAEMRLGARATEREMKAMSESGALAQYRVVHFATHGAMAGELSGATEPGLILTPPETASDVDDGYLSASEIAGLKLDADWVILSACNTAAGNAADAEPLSGLARAFIHAQARALLVSHWAVESNATVKLITSAMREMAGDAKLGRAEALRRAMLALIDGGAEHEAHPAFWAPFVVVGEGGR
jgi:CHAT domain-containing protein